MISEYILSLFQKLFAMIALFTTTLSVGSPEYNAKFRGNCPEKTEYVSQTTSNLLQNSSFEDGYDADMVPVSWKWEDGDAYKPVTDCTISRSGSCSLHFPPRPLDRYTRHKSIVQKIPYSGGMNTKIFLSGWNKAKDVVDAFPPKEPINYRHQISNQVRLTFYDHNGEAILTPLSLEFVEFKAGTHNFIYAEESFYPRVDFQCFDVSVNFHEYGEAWFDDLNVMIIPDAGLSPSLPWEE